MFWGDVQDPPNLSLNCSLVQAMLIHSLDEYRIKDPDKEYVETLTENMEIYIKQQLTQGKRTSIYQAFVEFT